MIKNYKIIPPQLPADAESKPTQHKPTNTMAAPVKAFREFHIVKEAYTQVRDHLDHIIKIENCPELGAIDPPL